MDLLIFFVFLYFVQKKFQNDQDELGFIGWMTLVIFTVAIIPIIPLCAIFGLYLEKHWLLITLCWQVIFLGFLFAFVYRRMKLFMKENHRKNATLNTNHDRCSGKRKDPRFFEKIYGLKKKN